jgi:hypothetical protein
MVSGEDEYPRWIGRRLESFLERCQSHGEVLQPALRTEWFRLPIDRPLGALGHAWDAEAEIDHSFSL